MAGFGAAVTTGAVAPGDTVAVIGCGGVGNAAIAGASIAGARMVIGVDVVERKLEWARRFGATHTIDATKDDPVEAIRALTGGFGADLVVDAVGRPETYVQAFLARDHAGRLVNVGVPPEQGMSVELPMSEVFGRGGSLRSSWYGDCLPTRDFPVLIDLYRKGRLDLDGFVSELISINDVEEAFQKITRSEVLRSVVVFTPR
jgi:S-(hydroxymethyl)mycothiol dehydrogenase